MPRESVGEKANSKRRQASKPATISWKGGGKKNGEDKRQSEGIERIGKKRKGWKSPVLCTRAENEGGKQK